jgi:NodT family efflux transporter outer membrane factor (OMF) lipoprotein
VSRGAPSARVLALGALATALSACTVGPNYHRPTAPTPVAYREINGWKPAQPRIAASGTAWWSIYDDPVLDKFEREIDVSNQNLKAAEEAYREAQAIVDEARAGYYPTVTGGASAIRSSNVVSGDHGNRSNLVANQFGLTAGASWAPDLWGKIRRTVESNVASAQASAADLASARLSAQATLATDYFELRIDDELKRVLDETIVADQHALDIATNQYNAGFAAETDVITAQTQLEGVQAQAINVGVQRAQLEHAIAVLVGKPPTAFSIEPASTPRAIPVAPAGIPSTLLERRPDIAAAERLAASAHAQIGVAIAAYYPDITLSVSTGLANSALQNLFSVANNVWSLGPALSETAFDGGLRDAQVAAARAVYNESVANYRQTVLTAFQQVEDELAALRILENEAAVEDAALRSSREALRLTLNQYQAGTVSYTNVVVAQTTALGDEQAVLTILQNRLIASVALVQALGGGWMASALPSPEQIKATATPIATKTNVQQ